MSNLPVNSGTLPGGFCPSTWQAVADAFAAIYSVPFNQASGINMVASATKPSDTTVGWLALDSLGRLQRTYFYGQGAWLSLHPMVPGSTIWWFQALPNFTSFDGGDGNVLGAQSGAMWQQAKDVNGNTIAAQFPMVAGTSALGTVFANGATGGEETHVLVPDESVPHQHLQFVAHQENSLTVPDGSNYIADKLASGNSTESYTASKDTSATSPSVGLGGVNGGIISTDSDAISFVDYTNKYKAKAHNTLPLYVVGYLLQRTTRLYYAIT